jgi:diguanylate cyclase (GGDEF)-like protein
VSILIVDDSDATNRSLRAFLQSRGYPAVRTVTSGAEALRLLGEGTPAASPGDVEVVLLDVGLPDLDGIEVCRRLKAALPLKDIPVLIITGATDEQTLEHAFAAGACDFLHKPIRLPELLARLRSALNLKRELDTCKAHERELVQVTRQLEQLNRELERLSILDELTSIANRRFFNVVLAQEWARAARAVLPLSLIMIDIDFFKNYNDHYGHLQGDDCLRRVATALSSLAKRPGDCVARYGGEEFVVVLAHTGVHGAATVAEGLRRQIESLRLEHPCSPVANWVTISLGVASTVPERSGSAELLVTAADQAVYEAKREGRNRVKLYQGTPGQIYQTLVPSGDAKRDGPPPGG